MKGFWLALSLFVAAPVAADVDSTLVGMWQLQWAGPQILWQVRADGTYRLMGTGARPNEHWGRMQAAGGRWSSEWERGKDQGTYSLQGNSWTVTGALGPGTWLRIWPGGAPSTATCPYIDIPSVERHFGSAVSSRMVGKGCEFSAVKPGIIDELALESAVINPSMDTLRLHRAACASGTNRDPSVRCIPGLGETAFFYNGALHIYQASSKVTVNLGTYPANQIVNDADSIAIGRIAVGRL